MLWIQVSKINGDSLKWPDDYPIMWNLGKSAYDYRFERAQSGFYLPWQYPEVVEEGLSDTFRFWPEYEHAVLHLSKIFPKLRFQTYNKERYMYIYGLYINGKKVDDAEFDIMQTVVVETNVLKQKFEMEVEVNLDILEGDSLAEYYVTYDRHKGRDPEKYAEEKARLDELSAS